MRGFVGIFLAVALSACSSSPDFCQQFQPVIEAQEMQISACPVPDAGPPSDGGAPDFATPTDALAVVGGEFPFSVQACEAQIISCNSNDLTELNHELACLKTLPAFDCSALGEEADAGLMVFMDGVGECQAQSLSPACTGGTNTMGCGTESHTANTSPNQPLPLGFVTPITDCLGVGDHHYLSLTPPRLNGDGGFRGGGYYEILFSQISANVQGQLTVKLEDTGGNELHNALYEISSQSTVFLSTNATATFLVDVSGDSQIALGYTISASYILINDPYKPDSQMSIAKTIQLDTPTSGSYLWAGQNSADALITGINGDFDDWFEVELPTAGTVSISLTGFPHDFAPAVDFVQQTGQTILPSNGAPSHSTMDGDIIDYMALAPLPGMYFAHVYPYEVDNLTYAAYSMGTLLPTPVLPGNYTQAYALTVSLGN